MPQCFQLTKRGKTEPEFLNVIDREICEFMGVEEHEKYYCEDWYNTIGFAISVGKSLGSQELRDWVGKYPDWEPLRRILVWLEEHYTSDAWYESSSRG